MPAAGPAAALPAPFGFRARNRIPDLNRTLAGRVLDFTHNHGVDRRLFSRALNQPRDTYVYLPPGYDGTTLFPVMLFLHGLGERTTPAGAEALARSLFDDDLAHTVLAVPIAQKRAQMHLDTVCTMVDTDTVVMYANVVDTLSAFTLRRTGHGVVIDDAEPFAKAVAAAIGIEKLRVIDTGRDPVVAQREQWDDGNNTLALAPRVAVAYERNVETNTRLEEAGIEVVAIAGSELGSGRGGPRCMSCPIARD